MLALMMLDVRFFSEKSKRTESASVPHFALMACGHVSQ